MSDNNSHYAVGVDLGGTKIELGIASDQGALIHHLRLETQVKKGAEVVKDQILEGIRTLQKESNVLIQGVGIGVAGQIHPQSGDVIFAPNLKWHHYPLQTAIETAFNIPVRVINDVRAITWGEWLYGAGKNCKDLLCIFVGTGIGGGVISGGRMLTGFSNTLGEIGHITVDFNGPLCTCGNKGCLEAYAGGWGIAERAKDFIKTADGQKGILLELAKGDLDQITAKLVVQAYRLDDPLAIRVIETAKKALIAGCSSLINAFNPSRLILGGGFIDGFPEMIQSVNKGIHQFALKAATKNLDVTKALIGKEVGILGSAAVIFDSLKQSGEITQ